MTAIAVTVNISPTCMTSLRETFSLSDTESGFLLSSIFWGFNLSLLVTGPLADRLGMRPLLTAAPGLQILGLFTCAAAFTRDFLVLGAFLMGIGSGILEVLVNPLVCMTCSSHKTRAINLCHAFYSIGAILSVLCASFIMDTWGWRTAYVVGILPCLAYGWIYRRTPLPSLQGYGPKTSPGSSLLRRPLLWLFLLAMLLAGGTELGPAQWTPVFLQDSFAIRGKNAALGLVLFSAAMAVGRLAMSRIASGKNCLFILKFAALACCLFIFSASVSRHSLHAFGSVFLIGFFVSVFWPTLLSLSADTFPDGGATLFSLLGMAGNASGILFPPLVGRIADTWNLQIGFGFMALIPLALGALLFVLDRETVIKSGA